MNDIATVTLIRYNKGCDEEMVIEYRLTFLRALFCRPKKAKHYVRSYSQAIWYEKGVLPPVVLDPNVASLLLEWCRQCELYGAAVS